MAFYGECHEMDWGANIAGTPVGDFDNLDYHFDGTSVMVASGESFTVGIFEDALNATSADSIEYSWVIECGAGSDGTLQLSDGLDPSWSYSAAVCTNDLGTQFVVGAATIVVPASVTHEQYWAVVDEPTIHIQCTAGIVEIQQVKMRLWPPGGPSGAWTEATEGSSYVTGGTTKYGQLGPPQSEGLAGMWDGDDDSYQEEGAQLTAMADAWVKARAAQQAHFGELHSYGTSGTAVASGTLVAEAHTTHYTIPDNILLMSARVTMTESIGVVVANYQDFSPELPEGWGLDPSEVWREEGAYLRNLDGGVGVPAVFGGWIDAQFHATYTTGHSSEPPPDGTLLWPVGPAAIHQINLGSYEPAVPAGFTTPAQDYYQFYAGGAQTAISPDGGTTLVDGAIPKVEVDIPFFGGSAILVLGRPPGFTDGSTMPRDYALPMSSGSPAKVSTSYLLSGQVAVSLPTSPTYRVSFPSFRYFDPSLPWEDPAAAGHYPPGFFLTPNPNLDGLGDRVEVHFATT